MITRLASFFVSTILPLVAAISSTYTQPTAKCLAKADAWCSDSSSKGGCPHTKVGGCAAGQKMYALHSTGEGRHSPQWRCYANSTLNANHTKYVHGTCYCTRNKEIEYVLCLCANDGNETKCGVAPPAGGAPAMPMPPPPEPPAYKGWTNKPVFWRGQTAADGTVYPCVRIPSIINAAGVLLAFAECRQRTGDGCLPGNYRAGGSRDVCVRRSTDFGASWSPLVVIAKDSGQDTAVYDAVRKQVIVQVLGPEGNGQVISTDLGLNWSAPQSLVPVHGSAPLPRSSTGPGVGIQLSQTNPHAPGRLLFIGHAGAYVQDYVWYSDDGGKSYALSKTHSGNSLPKMDEAQLVELGNGNVLANMRNHEKGHERGIALSTDGGATFGPVYFDAALPEPVCMGSVIRADPPLSDGNMYFANPGQAAGRVNGVVRRSRGCVGGSTHPCVWDRDPPVVNKGGDYAYSCLVPLNVSHIGLLWETSARNCTGPSCMQVFSVIPLTVFGPVVSSH